MGAFRKQPASGGWWEEKGGKERPEDQWSRFFQKEGVRAPLAASRQNLAPVLLALPFQAGYVVDAR